MTTVHISKENWKKINSLKQPGESVNDVVTRLLQIAGEIDLDRSLDLGFDQLLEEMMAIEHDTTSPTLEEVIEASRKGWRSD